MGLEIWFGEYKSQPLGKVHFENESRWNWYKSHIDFAIMLDAIETQGDAWKQANRSLLDARLLEECSDFWNCTDWEHRQVAGPSRLSYGRYNVNLRDKQRTQPFNASGTHTLLSGILNSQSSSQRVLFDSDNTDNPPVTPSKEKPSSSTQFTAASLPEAPESPEAESDADDMADLPVVSPLKEDTPTQTSPRKRSRGGSSASEDSDDQALTPGSKRRSPIKLGLADAEHERHASHERTEDSV
ncbi:hypothetical protein GGR57DRAFT_242356 [Xylariaceae sp. FL1272]|nr:hypothetical protein GGR57DRAFT_242356 [Xylariaceae sp. FL1272]